MHLRKRRARHLFSQVFPFSKWEVSSESSDQTAQKLWFSLRAAQMGQSHGHRGNNTPLHHTVCFFTLIPGVGGVREGDIEGGDVIGSSRNTEFLEEKIKRAQESESL